MEFYKPSDFTTPELLDLRSEIEESIRKSVKHYNDILRGIIQYILPQVDLEYNEENLKRITKEYRVDCDIYYLDFNTENQLILFSEIRKTEYKLGTDCSCNTRYSYQSNFKLPIEKINL